MYITVIMVVKYGSKKLSCRKLNTQKIFLLACAKLNARKNCKSKIELMVIIIKMGGQMNLV